VAVPTRKPPTSEYASLSDICEVRLRKGANTQTALKALKRNGFLEESAVASFAKRQRLVDKGTFDTMEVRYAAGAPTA
jgi:hypothetical protein